MQRCVLYSKCHRATVTAADLHYEGSLSLDPLLMRACGWVEFEKIQVVNINNGVRFETYLINAEQAGTGAVQLNGAAARCAQIGDLVIIMSYAWMDARQVATWTPKVVCLNSHNEIINSMAEV